MHTNSSLGSHTTCSAVFVSRKGEVMHRLDLVSLKSPGTNNYSQIWEIAAFAHRRLADKKDTDV